MEIETLVEIGVEIRDVISSFIEKNEDYGEMLVQRPKISHARWTWLLKMRLIQLFWQEDFLQE